MLSLDRTIVGVTTDAGSGGVELCFLSNLTSSEWAAWVQAVAATVAIVAGAGAIYWQVGRQHSLQIRREVEAELRVVRDLQQFLTFADHYLGRLVGATLQTELYKAYMAEGSPEADFNAVSNIFAETASGEIPGPWLKLGFKHCATAFRIASVHAVGSWNDWTRMNTINCAQDHKAYDAARQSFLQSAAVFRDRRSELESELSRLT